MSYLSDFEHSFMTRTLEILTSYKGEHDATLLINCLLGLLIVPKEAFPKAIPSDKFSTLPNWGIDASSIHHAGNATDNNREPATIRGLVVNLRHSVAHFDLNPVSQNSIVSAFEFCNDSGFHAIISLDDLRSFVERLARHLDNA